MLKYKDFVFLYFPSPQLSFVVVVQSLSHVQLFMSPWTAAHQAPLSSTFSRSWLKFMSSDSVMLSNHLILCHSLLLLPSVHHGLFQWVSSSHQVAKVLEFRLQCQSFQRILEGLISSRIDWFDLLAVQGTLKTPPAPQFESINSLVLSLVFCPTLTSIHDYWENHSFDCMDLCWLSNVSAF